MNNQNAGIKRLEEIYLLNSRQVAGILKVSRPTVDNWARDGKLPFVELPGGKKRYRLETIANILIDPETESARGLPQDLPEITYKSGTIVKR